MFRIHEIVKRGAQNKRVPPSDAEIFEERPDERSMPYLSVVPEQVFSDERYKQLNPLQKGQFWLLVVHVLWRDNGRCIRHHGAIAKRMGVQLSEWKSLEEALLKCDLLQLTPDGIYLLQAELRRQYLMTLQTCNNKRRKPPSRK